MASDFHSELLSLDMAIKYSQWPSSRVKTVVAELNFSLISALFIVS